MAQGNSISTALQGSGLDVLDPARGYNTAAQGATNAQAQANSLSDLQWQRQMGGLQQAQGYTGQLQDLYNSIYGGPGGATAAGGMQPTKPGGWQTPPASQMTLAGLGGGVPGSTPGSTNLGSGTVYQNPNPLAWWDMMTPSPGGGQLAPGSGGSASAFRGLTPNKTAAQPQKVQGR